MRRPPRRIALALESSGPGGAENVVLRLAAGLRAAGDEPVVVTMRPGWMTERAEAEGFEVWLAPQARGLAPGWVPRFALRLRRGGIDCLHSHEFAMNVYGGAAARLVGIPSVATIHGRNWATGSRRRGLAYRALRRLGMRVVAVSRDLAAFLAAGLPLPLEAISVVHNGIPLAAPLPAAAHAAARAATRRSLGIPVDAPLLLAVGNLYPVKDHATLLRAAATLPGVSVAIAGRGEEEEKLRALAAELGLGARLHLLGLRDDVADLHRAADLFVQPSRSEGLPLAILEAMGAGLPVVATRVGGIHEAVIDGRTGRLVPPADPAALAAALRELLDAPERRAAFGRAGAARAEQEFSLRAMTDAYRALYRGEVRPSAAR
ncbi:MAG TPA: glycosyltransferase [Myxococcota bacterium]|nr:glycosyltransferase [Myxococcota bacterium]